MLIMLIPKQYLVRIFSIDQVFVFKFTFCYTLDLTFFFEKQTHTQEKGKWVLTQIHIIIPLKSHDNF